MTDDGDQERKLAAILAADVVGFSRMMGADERGTLASLRAAREAVFDPIVAAHRGRVFKVMGDGLLVEFPSVVLALRAAVAVQAALPEHARAQPGPAVVLRIGIHQGDVVVQGHDLMGDGVNIASRLEALAEPGGICISARVREDALGRVALPMQDGGARQLKNIAEPVRVFHILPAGATPEPAQHSEETTIMVSMAGLHSLVLLESTTAGPPRGHTVRLASPGLTLGRQSPSDLVLPGGEVSRTHCRFELAGMAVTLTDLRSTNGTYVDGVRIGGPTRLAHGALVRLGPYTVRYACEMPADGNGPDPEATHVIRR